MKPSSANYFIPDVHDVGIILDMLANHSAKAKKAFSSSDLLGLVKHEPINRFKAKRRTARHMAAFEEEFEEEEEISAQPMRDIFNDRWQANITANPNPASNQ
jgi:hypothetical protein